ncbi:MAG: GNAT family N-acetyltransferase [Candidatus Thermoplasmatota archaeon]|jgi:RimJ/RimL family protein N-acetyltransferase|nr:GNAT family N-acetyltransferase [Candidatus Thermoplasmatota archaeon]MCL6002711.1 GNAT family N-acetyltransferase [Candidatus Thermoplasmatota archaeon]
MIELVPMDDNDFKEYLSGAIENYANEKIKSGNWNQSDAKERSRKEFETLLPEGTRTRGQHLFTIHDKATNEKVGMIWVGIREPEDEIAGAWIWDFMVYERERGKGYGKDALKALDKILKELGQKRVSLHVFGHNEVAIGLYSKSGYKVTNLVMSKDLDQ